MSRFILIDSKLNDFANKLNGKLKKDRAEYPVVMRTFEERRIDWIDNEINKAIIIQPNFEAAGINSAIWNFINIAWLDDGKSVKRLKWIHFLIEKSEFGVIENRIDELLCQSEKDLKDIQMENLK